LKFLSLAESNPNYLKGLSDILKSKKNILMEHAAYFKENLPKSLLEDFGKIDVSFI
jgi:hypothetical protein